MRPQWRDEDGGLGRLRRTRFGDLMAWLGWHVGVRTTLRLTYPRLTEVSGHELPGGPQCEVGVLILERKPVELWRREPSAAVRGGIQYRAQCPSCPRFQGPLREREDEAIEDAHDHAYPGWRELPALDPSVVLAGARAATRWMTWVAEATRAYPPGWFQRRGPVITYRSAGSTRHLPGQAPGGGYDMARPWPLKLPLRIVAGPSAPSRDRPGGRPGEPEDGVPGDLF